MPGIIETSTLWDFQTFVHDVYGMPNDRHYGLGDMLANFQRFTMRALKGVRKNDVEKIKNNLLVSFSWFGSIMNRLHIDINVEVWNRFPYLCSYCVSCPCICGVQKPSERQMIVGDEKLRPITIRDFQGMFQKIYPSESRTLEHAAVHLAEELGEFSEAILAFRGQHNDSLFRNVAMESADIFSCLMGIFNSLDVDMVSELSTRFSENCHVCKKAPCGCSFDSVMNFKS